MEQSTGDAKYFLVGFSLSGYNTYIIRKMEGFS